MFFYRINHFNSKWRVKYLVLFVVGAASLTPSRCKQNSPEFFSAPFESFLEIFAKRVYWVKLCNLFWWFQLWYFAHCAWCFFSFGVSFCVGGLPHKKGVCILSILDVFIVINHFNSKWRVKYLVLFVVGARKIFSSSCWKLGKEAGDSGSSCWTLGREAGIVERLSRVSSKFLPNAFMSQTLQLFWWFQLWYFCSLCLMFFIFCVSFCVGGLPHKKGVCILDSRCCLSYQSL